MASSAVYGYRAYWLAHEAPMYYLSRLLGFHQTKQQQKSELAQIDYNEYLKAGFNRQLSDWKRNVGSKGVSGYRPTIRYPELTYPGQIYRTDTATARAMYDYDIAGSNVYGRSLYGSAGLYGVGSRVSRWL